jgi:hypothetical protein
MARSWPHRFASILSSSHIPEWRCAFPMRKGQIYFSSKLPVNPQAPRLKRRQKNRSVPFGFESQRWGADGAERRAAQVSNHLSLGSRSSASMRSAPLAHPCAAEVAHSAGEGRHEDACAVSTTAALSGVRRTRHPRSRAEVHSRLRAAESIDRFRRLHP